MAEGFLEDVEQKLPEYFGLLPKGKLEVRRVEPFREQPALPRTICVAPSTAKDQAYSISIFLI